MEVESCGLEFRSDRWLPSRSQMTNLSGLCCGADDGG